MTQTRAPGQKARDAGAATSRTFGIHHADRPRRGRGAVRRLLPRPADRGLDRLGPARRRDVRDDLRPGRLLHAGQRAARLVVCPPLAFLAGSVLAQLLDRADAFSAATGILVTLGTSAPWLFTGTGLTVVIALGRGWRPELAMAMLGSLREALRDIRPRGTGGSGGGSPAGRPASTCPFRRHRAVQAGQACEAPGHHGRCPRRASGSRSLPVTGATQTLGKTGWPA